MSHTPPPWTVEIARQAENAPAFGFAIKAAGRVPFVASAGVATPDHGLIIAEPFRNLVTTGFTPEEVQANGYLIGAAPGLLAACRRAAQFIRNGVELGYIRMPDGPDPAHYTLPALDAAINLALSGVHP